MDRAIDLTLLPRRLDPTLSEQLAGSTDERARLGLLERHLRGAAEHVRPHRRLRAAVELVLRSHGPLFVSRPRRWWA